MFDWNSFWVNIYAGAFYFVVGILFSIWLIPIFTLRLIRKKNKKYLKGKISYAISEICYFFTRMPPEFRVNEETCQISSANIRYPDISDHVAILKPNLFKPTAIEETYLKILTSIAESEAIDRYELLEEEMVRLNRLRLSLEGIVGLHSNSLEDSIMNEISQLCLNIRTVENDSQFNQTTEKLLGYKDGTFGLNGLNNVYESAYSLLVNLVKQKGFKHQVMHSD